MNEARKARIGELRRREYAGTLTEAEREELDAIFAGMDAEETEALRPAMERMDQEQLAMQAEQARLVGEIEQLQRILAEQKALREEAQEYAARLRARNASLAAEYERITHQTAVSGS